ncbi:acyltransferase [Streptomyces profundus]|nr:acyltransferase [Streptomyces sp. MA3_2.13]UED83841.1 acyltransferase [Streptomyces sp. MA3_2.13]
MTEPHPHDPESAPSQDAPEEPRLLDYNGWLFWQRADDEQKAAQLARQQAILARCPGRIGPRGFVSELAMVSPSSLRLGADCYVAAHAYVTGTIHAGDDCTVNPFTVLRGTVTLGNGVRIGAHSSILGFNHSMAPDRPVHRQPTSERGITIGDDVWIGSNAVLLDGITVGSHAVIGAGAVVTRDVQDWAVVGGNPARFIRDRRTPKGAPAPDPRAKLAARLAELADRAREQSDTLIARNWEPAGIAPDGTPTGRYLDAPDAPPTLRAHADAVEISFLLGGRPPAQLPAEEHVRRLRRGQDPTTGLTPPLGRDGRPGPPVAGLGADGDADYHLLSLGYALDLLGSGFAHPIGALAALGSDELADWLAALPWRDAGWAAGAGVDTLGTALLWNRDRPGARRQLDTFFGWLLTRARPDSGLWSPPRAGDGLLQPVNGYYRATRGSFAQFGLPVPHPDLVIDTVLRHAEDQRHFGPGRTTACNVLDVAHPLWLARRQLPDHRREDVAAWAAEQAGQLCERWVDNEGFPFRFPPLAGPRDRSHRPGAQGTEMWLATLWYLADLLDVAESLSYRPRGVHRPEPAITLD